MGGSRAEDIDYVVFVDSRAYYEFPYKRKPDIAHIIGDINHHFRKSNQNLLLFVPGRIGTSSPELGVPVSFAAINHFCAICEMSDSEVGYMPELSYGSHMFQDLVEAEIVEPGMVFCVDIGIYCEEWGIGFRLEDNCLVTEDGCENLTGAIPRTIEDIEAVMAGKMD